MEVSGIEAVVSSFDADGSGQVDTAEFSSLLNEHISRAQQGNGNGKNAGGAGAGAQEGDAGSGGGGDGGDGGRINKGPRDGRAVIGLQWDTSGHIGKKAGGEGGGDKAAAAAAAAPASSSEGVDVDLEQNASVGISTS